MLRTAHAAARVSARAAARAAMLPGALVFGLAMAAPGEARAAYMLNLQPWAMCAGSVVDASCDFPSFDSAYLNEIYAQIDVTVNVLPLQAVTDFPFTPYAANPAEIDAEDSVTTFAGFIAFVGAGPNTAHFGFAPDMEDGVLGIAAVGDLANPIGLVQALDGGTLAESLRETVILAHELAHVLGGTHALAPDPLNLLYPFINPSAGTEGFMPSISAANAEVMLASGLLLETAVPIPAPGALLLAGLGALAWRRRGAAAG